MTIVDSAWERVNRLTIVDRAWERVNCLTIVDRAWERVNRLIVSYKNSLYEDKLINCDCLNSVTVSYRRALLPTPVSSPLTKKERRAQFEAQVKAQDDMVVQQQIQHLHQFGQYAPFDPNNPFPDPNMPGFTPDQNIPGFSGFPPGYSGDPNHPGFHDDQNIPGFSDANLLYSEQGFADPSIANQCMYIRFLFILITVNQYT